VQYAQFVQQGHMLKLRLVWVLPIVVAVAATVAAAVGDEVRGPRALPCVVGVLYRRSWPWWSCREGPPQGALLRMVDSSFESGLGSSSAYLQVISMSFGSVRSVVDLARTRFDLGH
jgi:hypothetical protein